MLKHSQAVISWLKIAPMSHQKYLVLSPQTQLEIVPMPYKKKIPSFCEQTFPRSLKKYWGLLPQTWL